MYHDNTLEDDNLHITIPLPMYPLQHTYVQLTKYSDINLVSNGAYISLDIDKRKVKSCEYKIKKVPNYWIVDLKDQQDIEPVNIDQLLHNIYVYRDPLDQILQIVLYDV